MKRDNSVARQMRAERRAELRKDLQDAKKDLMTRRPRRPTRWTLG